MQLDSASQSAADNFKDPMPHTKFSKTLFRQPSLAGKYLSVFSGNVLKRGCSTVDSG
jgi:hypothetical protein